MVRWNRFFLFSIRKTISHTAFKPLYNEPNACMVKNIQRPAF